MSDIVDYIDTPQGVADWARHLAAHPVIAVDLEADSLFHFRERVCLLQFAAGGRRAVVDPLAVSDLSLLKPVFADAGIQKVFHGADYDVRSLYRDFGIEIRNLFDTQVAAMMLGSDETGLDAVVRNRFGMTLNKACRKKDWSQRPLPEEMIGYAADDVVHLGVLAQMMTDELVALGRLDWVLEECDLLRKVRPADTNGQPLFLRCRGAGRLNRRQLGVLEALLEWRVGVAERRDRPLFKVLGNKVLLGLAVAAPQSTSTLAQGGLLSGRQSAMFGPGILDAVRRGTAIPQDQLPKYPRQRTPPLPTTVAPRIDSIRQWRDGAANDLGLEPSLICTKLQMTAVAVANPKRPADLDAIPELKNWQRRAFGGAMVAALNSA